MHVWIICPIVSIFMSNAALGVSLGGECETDENCGTLDSHCRNHTCVCIPNFNIFEDSCIEVLSPRTACTRDAECRPITGQRSICIGLSCSCPQFHHEHKGQCVKNRVLNDRCEKDFQCYWGQKMRERMGCYNSKCSCKPGYIPRNDRQCIAAGAKSKYKESSLSTLIQFVLLLVIYFKTGIM